jgi:2-dehydro-3-deoxyphosphooctonate aldolase (KDO 8-P synthase)
MNNSFQMGDIQIGLKGDLFVIAGPCVIEDEGLCLEIAKELVALGKKTGVKIIFKASFDKANRTSINSFRGPGMEKGLRTLDKVRQATALSLVTDVHESSQAQSVAKVVDILQIPAFLCRQTDLLIACAKTGKAVNVKKGQFVSPAEMKNAVQKIHDCGNDKILLTERGTFFGYNRLVNDMTAIPEMQALGCPVIFDCTHSTQRPGGLGQSSGGSRELAPILARAAIAAGANALFMEVHPEPEKALCDAASMLKLDQVEGLLKQCKMIFQMIRQPE